MWTLPAAVAQDRQEENWPENQDERQLDNWPPWSPSPPHQRSGRHQSSQYQWRPEAINRQQLAAGDVRDALAIRPAASQADKSSPIKAATSFRLHHQQQHHQQHHQDPLAGHPMGSGRQARATIATGQLIDKIIAPGGAGQLQALGSGAAAESSPSSVNSTAALQNLLIESLSVGGSGSNNQTGDEESIGAASNQAGASSSSVQELKLLLFALLVSINLVVILGNILVIVAVHASAKLRSVTNIFIVSLATADLLLGIFVLPYALVYEVLDVWIFGEILCRGWLVTDVWISTASILNLCAISIDRYVAVTRPVKYRSIMTNRRAKCIVAIVWILAFIICLPPLLTEWSPSGPWGPSDGAVGQHHQRQPSSTFELLPPPSGSFNGGTKSDSPAWQTSQAQLESNLSSQGANLLGAPPLESASVLPRSAAEFSSRKRRDFVELDIFSRAPPIPINLIGTQILPTAPMRSKNNGTNDGLPANTAGQVNKGRGDGEGGSEPLVSTRRWPLAIADPATNSAQTTRVLSSSSSPPSSLTTKHTRTESDTTEAGSRAGHRSHLVAVAQKAVENNEESNTNGEPRGDERQFGASAKSRRYRRLKRGARTKTLQSGTLGGKLGEAGSSFMAAAQASADPAKIKQRLPNKPKRAVAKDEKNDDEEKEEELEEIKPPFGLFIVLDEEKEPERDTSERKVKPAEDSRKSSSNNDNNNDKRDDDEDEDCDDDGSHKSFLLLLLCIASDCRSLDDGESRQLCNCSDPNSATGTAARWMRPLEDEPSVEAAATRRRGAQQHQRPATRSLSDDPGAEGRVGGSENLSVINDNNERAANMSRRWLSFELCLRLCALLEWDFSSGSLTRGPLVDGGVRFGLPLGAGEARRSIVSAGRRDRIPLGPALPGESSPSQSATAKAATTCALPCRLRRRTMVGARPTGSNGGARRAALVGHNDFKHSNSDNGHEKVLLAEALVDLVERELLSRTDGNKVRLAAPGDDLRAYGRPTSASGRRLGALVAAAFSASSSGNQTEPGTRAHGAHGCSPGGGERASTTTGPASERQGREVEGDFISNRKMDSRVSLTASQQDQRRTPSVHTKVTKKRRRRRRQRQKQQHQDKQLRRLEQQICAAFSKVAHAYDSASAPSRRRKSDMDPLIVLHSHWRSRSNGPMDKRECHCISLRLWLGPVLLLLLDAQWRRPIDALGQTAPGHHDELEAVLSARPAYTQACLVDFAFVLSAFVEGSPSIRAAASNGIDYGGGEGGERRFWSEWWAVVKWARGQIAIESARDTGQLGRRKSQAGPRPKPPPAGRIDNGIRLDDDDEGGDASAPERPERLRDVKMAHLLEAISSLAAVSANDPAGTKAVPVKKFVAPKPNNEPAQSERPSKQQRHDNNIYNSAAAADDDDDVNDYFGAAQRASPPIQKRVSGEHPGGYSRAASLGARPTRVGLLKHWRRRSPESRRSIALASNQWLVSTASTNSGKPKQVAGNGRDLLAAGDPKRISPSISSAFVYTSSLGGGNGKEEMNDSVGRMMSATAIRLRRDIDSNEPKNVTVRVNLAGGDATVAPKAVRAKSGCALFHEKIYVVYSALGSFFIPMLIMVFFYSRIYLVASRAQKAMQRGYMTTKWPPMATSKKTGAGATLAANNNGSNGKKDAPDSKNWTRGSFKRTSLIRASGTARYSRKNSNESLPTGGAGQRAGGGSGGLDSSGGSPVGYLEHANGQPPERVMLRIHRRTEPPPQPPTPPNSLPRQTSSVSSGQQPPTSRPYQTFAIQMVRTFSSQQRQTPTVASRLLRALSNDAPDRGDRNKSKLMQLIAVEQQMAMKKAADERQARFSFDQTNEGEIGASKRADNTGLTAIQLPRKRSSLPPAIKITESAWRQVADAVPSQESGEDANKVQISETGESDDKPDKEAVEPGEERRQQQQASVSLAEARCRHSGDKRERHRHRSNGRRRPDRHRGNHNHRTRSSSKSRDTRAGPRKEAPNGECDCVEPRRERDLDLSDDLQVTSRECQLESATSITIFIDDASGEEANAEKRETAGESRLPELTFGEHGSGALTETTTNSSPGQMDRSHGYGPMPTIVVNWYPDRGQAGSQFVAARQSSETLQASMPALSMAAHQENRAGASETQLSPETVCSSPAYKNSLGSGRIEEQRHHQSYSGSGLSLVANIPQQVRKQSMMLLSSLTSRSGQTLRRLSMAAAHPVDTFLLKSRAASSRRRSSSSSSSCYISSLSFDGDFEPADDDEDPNRCQRHHGHRHPKGRTSDESNADRAPGRCERRLFSAKKRRHRHKRKQRFSPDANNLVSPKKTLDDYLMAVAGIDTSSDDQDEGDSIDDDDDEEEEEDDDDEEEKEKEEANEELDYSLSTSSSFSPSSPSGASNLTAMLRRENLFIPTIAIVSPESDDSASRMGTLEIDPNNVCQPKETSADGYQEQSAPRGGTHQKMEQTDFGRLKMRAERLLPSAGCHRQGGIYESATSRRQSQMSRVVSSGADCGTQEPTSAKPAVNHSYEPSCGSAAPPQRRSPDLFRLLDPRSRRIPGSSNLNSTARTQDGVTSLRSSTATQVLASMPDQSTKTTARRRGLKRTSRWHAKRLRAETKAAKTVGIIVGGFIFCWLPFFTAYLWRAIVCSSPDCIPQTWLSLSIWLGYMNSAINPIIYGLFSADFRQAFKSIVCRCRVRNYVQSPHHLQHQAAGNETAVVSVLADGILKSFL